MNGEMLCFEQHLSNQHIREYLLLVIEKKTKASYSTESMCVIGYGLNDFRDCRSVGLMMPGRWNDIFCPGRPYAASCDDISDKLSRYIS
jgi:hypothetical protein